MGKPNEEEDLVALKYLELARGEILERVKLSNQFVIVYLGGISALIGWFFSGNGTAQNVISLRDAMPAVATGLSILSCAFSWILRENERMIELLARYQQEELKEWAEQFSFSMWESSRQLSEEKPRQGAMVAHTMIINLPNALVMLYAYSHDSPGLGPYVRSIFLVAAFILLLVSCAVSYDMIRRREIQRHKR